MRHIGVGEADIGERAKLGGVAAAGRRQAANQHAVVTADQHGDAAIGRGADAIPVAGGSQSVTAGAVAIAVERKQCIYGGFIRAAQAQGKAIGGQFADAVAHAT